MLINCTNHPYEIWGEAQRIGAGCFGGVLDFPFPQIDPRMTTEELRELAGKTAEQIEGMHPEAVLLAGEFSFTFMLADKLDVSIEDIVLDKLEKTKAKYPVDRAKGVSTKYDKLLDAAAKK